MKVRLGVLLVYVCCDTVMQELGTHAYFPAQDVPCCIDTATSQLEFFNSVI